MSYRVELYGPEIGDEEVRAVEDVLRSGWLSLGPVTAAFEDEFAAAVGAEHATAVSSGTAALHLAALALDLAVGDEVIVPSLSFVASAAAFVHAGATPVFADVTSLDDPTVDPEDVERRITDRTRAIVAVHYAGFPAAMAALRRLADEHSLALVEDVAHAPLVPTPEGALGTIGDIGCFSFFATKNLTTAEGGMVVARDPAHHARVRALRAHAVERPAGGSATYDVTALGLNYRPSEITSALGRVQLGRQAEDRRRREAVRAAYERELTGVHVPFRGSAAPSAHHLMAVVLPASTDRAAVQAALADDGVQTSVHYPPAHLLSYYRERFGCREGSLPVTEDFTARELSLPMHARMSDEDVAYVASALRSHLDAAVGSTA